MRINGLPGRAEQPSDARTGLTARLALTAAPDQRQSARSTMEMPGNGTTNFPPSAK